MSELKLYRERMRDHILKVLFGETCIHGLYLILRKSTPQRQLILAFSASAPEMQMVVH